MIRLWMFFKWVIVLFVLHFSPILRAEPSRISIAGMGGFGSSFVQDASKVGDTQGPTTVGVSVDYQIDGRYTLGTEHFRTISSRSGSAVGVTGFVLRSYFYSSHPLTKDSESFSNSFSRIEAQAFSPYWGVGTGIGQASILDTKINAVAFVMNLKMGLDWPLKREWGFRTEGNLSTSLGGSGTIQVFMISMGAYLNL